MLDPERAILVERGDAFRRALRISGLDSSVVACTNATIAFLAAPSFHDGSGSALRVQRRQRPARASRRTVEQHIDARRYARRCCDSSSLDLRCNPWCKKRAPVTLEAPAPYAMLALAHLLGLFAPCFFTCARIDERL